MAALKRELNRLAKGKPPRGRPQFTKATRFRIWRTGKWLRKREKLAEDCRVALALLKEHHGNLAWGQRRRKGDKPTLRKKVMGARLGWAGVGLMGGTLAGILSMVIAQATEIVPSGNNAKSWGLAAGVAAASVAASPFYRDRETRVLVDIHNLLKSRKLYATAYGEKLPPDQIKRNQQIIRELRKKLIALRQMNASELERLRTYLTTARTVGQVGVKA